MNNKSTNFNFVDVYGSLIPIQYYTLLWGNQSHITNPIQKVFNGKVFIPKEVVEDLSNKISIICRQLDDINNKYIEAVNNLNILHPIVKERYTTDTMNSNIVKLLQEQNKYNNNDNYRKDVYELNKFYLDEINDQRKEYEKRINNIEDKCKEKIDSVEKECNKKIYLNQENNKKQLLELKSIVNDVFEGDKIDKKFINKIIDIKIKNLNTIEGDEKQCLD